MNLMIKIASCELYAAELLLGEPGCNEYWERFYLRKELSPRLLEGLWFAPYIPVYYEEKPGSKESNPLGSASDAPTAASFRSSAPDSGPLFR